MPDVLAMQCFTLIAISMQVIITEKEAGIACFLCNQWLSMNKGDGATSRDLLPSDNEGESTLMVNEFSI